MLIGSEEGAVHQDSAVNEVEAPVTGALEDARDLRAGSGFLGGGGQNLGDHLAKGAQERVAGAGGRQARPEETQRRIARSSAFLGGVGCARRLRGLRPAWAVCGLSTVGLRLIGLGVGLRDVGVVDFLLLLFEGLGRGKLLRSGLLAGGEELLQRAASLAGVGHEAVVLGAVGMGDLAGGGVGEIAYVAAFDVDAFAAAYIGHVQLDVLRAGRNAHQHSDDESHAEAPHIPPLAMN